MIPSNLVWTHPTANAMLPITHWTLSLQQLISMSHRRRRRSPGFRWFPQKKKSNVELPTMNPIRSAAPALSFSFRGLSWALLCPITRSQLHHSNANRSINRTKSAFTYFHLYFQFRGVGYINSIIGTHRHRFEQYPFHPRAWRNLARVLEAVVSAELLYSEGV